MTLRGRRKQKVRHLPKSRQRRYVRTGIWTPRARFVPIGTHHAHFPGRRSRGDRPSRQLVIPEGTLLRTDKSRGGKRRRSRVQARCVPDAASGRPKRVQGPRGIPLRMGRLAFRRDDGAARESRRAFNGLFTEAIPPVYRTGNATMISYALAELVFGGPRGPKSSVHRWGMTYGRRVLRKSCSRTRGRALWRRWSRFGPSSRRGSAIGS